MKKSFVLLISLFVVATAFAQTQTDEEKTTSKTLEFLSKDGSFIVKEFYDVGKVKGVECQVLIATDVVKKEKMGCLRLEKTYYSSYSSSGDSYIGTLDYDELDACIKSIDYIIETLLPSGPSVYTESEYKTRDNVKVGAFYDEKKNTWSAFVYTKGHTSRSAAFFDSSSLSDLKNVMIKAKEIIREKLGK
ncbi:MAG: hypothetical protein IKG90_02665 [Bacteroidales bacterium]|nr:hypothetical protein [Bacteroidales bacterium]